MVDALRPLVAGNWKMNGVKAALGEAKAMRDAVEQGAAGPAGIVICPPFTLIHALAEVCAGSATKIGGQSCHAKASGAHTGEISAEMLRDAGADFVIVGHSERRTDHQEADEIVRAKAEAAIRAGLTAIVCVGETRAERDQGRTLAILETQIKGSVPVGAGFSPIVVAYEPVWAIGTGLTPTLDDVAKAHAFIRETLDALLPGQGASVRILYGGSVKPANAKALMAVDHVNGALVGGASLTATDFLGIAAAYR